MVGYATDVALTLSQKNNFIIPCVGLVFCSKSCILTRVNVFYTGKRVFHPFLGPKINKIPCMWLAFCSKSRIFTRVNGFLRGFLVFTSWYHSRVNAFYTGKRVIQLFLGPKINKIPCIWLAFCSKSRIFIRVNAFYTGKRVSSTVFRPQNKLNPLHLACVL